MEAARKKETAPVRVLVAEDSPTQRQIIMSLLRHEGLDVVMASDGIEAVVQAYREHPDLVVLDIEMPRMNGYQVCRLLKDDRRTSHIPIIMLTSRSQETDKYWGLKTGADRYVTKDFQLTGLAITVHELLKEEGVAQDRPVSTGASFNHEAAAAEVDVDVLSRVNDLLDRKLYEATIINEISKLNTLSEDCAVAVGSVLKVITNVTDCQVCSVFLLEEKELFVHVREPLGKEYLERVRRDLLLELSQHVPRLNIAQVKVNIDPNADNPDGAPDHEEGIRSMLALPLKARGQLIAFLLMTSPQPDAFDEDIRRLLEIIEYPVSLVLDNARLHEGTRKLAVTDGLTRLYNHRHFYELMEQEFSRAKRYESKLSMVMIDIDSFKHINDTHGHQIGDDVLKKLALVISSMVRDVDILARYGGEEFALLLPETGVDVAMQVAERIRKSVEAHEFNLPDGGKVTISLGVAGFPACGASSHIELVQITDAALYGAKTAGKNRVVVGDDCGKS